MVSSLYFSFTHYDLLELAESRSAWRTTGSCSRRIPSSGRRIRNTHLHHRGRGAAADRVRDPHGDHAHVAAHGDQGLSDDLLPARRWLRRSRPRWRSSTCSIRASDPSNHVLNWLGHEEPAYVVLLARRVQVGARVPRAVGDRRRDDHLPGRRCSTFLGSCTRPPTSRERRAGRSSASSRSP